MRKLLAILLVSGVILSFSGAALADSIKGSKHDLSASGHAEVATTESQVCVFCHTPHNSRTIGPLWNRNNNAAAYSVYASESLDATVSAPTPGADGRVATMASGSDLCLSCHDGTISVASVVKNAFHNDGTRPNIELPATLPTPYALDANGKLVRTGNLGTDLSNDHPVGFDYAAARTAENTRLGRTDAQSQLAATKVRGSQAFVDGAVNPTNGTGVDLPLFAGKMECDTCHNVHDPGADGGTMTLYPFLRADMNASKLCFTCHVK
ncbi:MAG: hypothetical protein ACM3UP_01175 [Methanocella sp.]